MTQKPSNEELKLFSELFAGYEHAHGQYEINREEGSGKKLGRAQTYARPASESDYLNHLLGRTGIGIVPLRKDDDCWFGAIDIDIKGDRAMRETHEELERKVRRYDLPLVMFRSKSNGAHLYFFGSEPVSAKLLQERLNEFASVLGYGGCEVFPKQIMRLKSEDAGNWINLPLFGDERCAFYDGKELSREKALKLCTYSRKTEKELRDFRISQSDEFSDGPPCLQTIHTSGIGEGGRNNTMINVAIYFVKKFPDDWQEKIHEYNEQYLIPPLPKNEISEIIRNCSRKDYNYTCKQAPICNFCDKKACKSRKYGIAFGSDSKTEHIVLPITDVIKYVAGKDSYRWGVNTGTAMLQFTSEELTSIDAHRRKYMELLNIVLPPIKEKEFFEQLRALLARCETIHDPEDASEEGQLIAAIEGWIYSKRSVGVCDELTKDAWWRNPENNIIYFRAEALQEYLKNSAKILVKPHKLWRCLAAEMKAEKAMLNIMGRRRRVWALPGFNVEETMSLPVPEMEQQVEEI